MKNTICFLLGKHMQTRFMLQEVGDGVSRSAHPVLVLALIALSPLPLRLSTAAVCLHNIEQASAT